jgi:formylmethanofuran dehydrogenase subunit C
VGSGHRIIIDGDVTRNIGYGMSGGEIHLNGDYDYIPQKEIIKGRIFHKGRLIVDK